MPNFNAAAAASIIRNATPKPNGARRLTFHVAAAAATPATSTAAVLPRFFPFPPIVKGDEAARRVIQTDTGTALPAHPVLAHQRPRRGHVREGHTYV